MTLDPKVAPAEYNYRNKAETEAAVGHSVKMEGEDPGCGGGFLCAAGIVVYLYRSEFKRTWSPEPRPGRTAPEHCEDE